uniref:Peptidase 1-like n=1 Tax=Dermatophagoides pteronyssinus TaxID=6956 RepID=A0A6P6YFI7_DERPT
MKFISIVATVLLLLLEFNNARPSPLIRTFDEFKAAYNKTYATDEQEEIARKNFLESLKYVQSKNNQSIAISHLSDLPLDEQQIKINKNLITANICHIDSNMTISDEIDLRSLGTLPPIRMQGN